MFPNSTIIIYLYRPIGCVGTSSHYVHMTVCEVHGWYVNNVW